MQRISPELVYYKIWSDDLKEHMMRCIPKLWSPVTTITFPGWNNKLNPVIYIYISDLNLEYGQSTFRSEHCLHYDNQTGAENVLMDSKPTVTHEQLVLVTPGTSPFRITPDPSNLTDS